MNPPNHAQTIALGLLGGIVGGAVGYFLFLWILQQGFYALILPGWLIGVGAALSARARSRPLAVICAVLAFALGLFTEWRSRPFTTDPSFAYFFAHLHKLTPMTWIMIGLGVFFSYGAALRTRGA